MRMLIPFTFKMSTQNIVGSRCVSIGMDFMATALIAIKLMQHRRRQKYAGGTAHQIYTSLMIVFIEASCLSTAFKIAYTTSFYLSEGSTVNDAIQCAVVPCAVSG